MKALVQRLTMPSRRASASYWLYLVVWLHLDYAHMSLYSGYWSLKLLHTEQTLSPMPSKAIQWADFYGYATIDADVLLPYCKVLGWSELLFYLQLSLLTVLYLLLPLALELCRPRLAGRVTLAVDLLFLLGLGWLLGSALHQHTAEAGVIPLWLFYSLYYCSAIALRLHQYRA